MSIAGIDQKWHAKKLECKPCPICHSKRLGLNHYSVSVLNFYFVECEECYACGRDAFTISGAIRKWNKRSKE